MNVLGCEVSDDLLTRWMHLLVWPVAPFFLTETDRVLAPSESISFTRAEAAADHSDIPLEMSDSYTTYYVGSEATRVVLLTDDLLNNLAPERRRALLRAQQRLGRGQVYDLALAHDLCGDSVSAHKALTPWSFETDEGDFVVLQHCAWWSFSEDIRRRWLLWFITTVCEF